MQEASNQVGNDIGNKDNILLITTSAWSTSACKAITTSQRVLVWKAAV